MITLNQVVRAYREGLDINISMERKIISRGVKLKGEYDPGQLEVIIFIKNIESEYDKDITILHEVGHAVEDILFPNKAESTEEEMERKAIETYNKRKEVLEFIKIVYRVCA